MLGTFPLSLSFPWDYGLCRVGVWAGAVRAVGGLVVLSSWWVGGWLFKQGWESWLYFASGWVFWQGRLYAWLGDSMKNGSYRIKKRGPTNTDWKIKIRIFIYHFMNFYLPRILIMHVRLVLERYLNTRTKLQSTAKQNAPQSWFRLSYVACLSFSDSNICWFENFKVELMMVCALDEYCRVNSI